MITSFEPSSILSKESKSGKRPEDSSKRKRGRKIPPSLVFLFLSIGLIGIGFLSLKFGSVSISFEEIARLLFLDKSSLSESELPHSLLVWDLRLPRFLLSLAVGACLASAGVCIQGLFRNPLVEPGFIGVGPGAALAASAWIVYSESLFSFLPKEMTGQGSFFLQIFAFGGALIVSFLLHLISRKEGGGFSLVLVLTGIAVNATVISLLGFLSYAADDNQLRNLTFWSLGSMAGATWHKVTLLALVLGFVSLFFPVLSRGLDALALGEADAFHTGFKVKKIRNLTILLSSLLVGISISLTGNIGFVGLIVPHILRMLLGPGHRVLLPASLLGGGLLVAIADLTARTIVFPSELPIGIIACGLGGTFFLVLILRSKRKEGQFR
ncbi:FecCD family ABC transporter permease [Leptospira wolffii]|uniref:FecCD family ABC transporter permease n=1 Tax=Leptospira wolffii TaxID=409998 RepID=UPI0002E1F414|nr:iron ABC transporter permease [Leptospira wolffii]EPG64241.1 iron chelate uptake ABC transporter, FeCT family, permease protein [Leptospira wolffii serovar Khorat str. Khorat-H2]